MYKFFLKDAENHEHNEKCLFSSVVFVIISFLLEIRKRNSNGIGGWGKVNLCASVRVVEGCCPLLSHAHLHSSELLGLFRWW